MNRNAQKTVFNNVADELNAALRPYEQAIAVMKELQSWGPDAKGQSFSFEIFRAEFPLPRKYVIIGGFFSEENKDCAVPHLAIGLPLPVPGKGRVPKFCEEDFLCVMGWAGGDDTPQRRLEDLIRVRFPVSEWHLPYDPKGKDMSDAVIHFAKWHMKDHPRMLQAVQDAVSDFVSKMPPMSGGFGRI